MGTNCVLKNKKSFYKAGAGSPRPKKPVLSTCNSPSAEACLRESRHNSVAQCLESDASSFSDVLVVSDFSFQSDVTDHSGLPVLDSL